MAMIVLSGPRIPAGESLSNPIDCTMGHPVRITMPTKWNSALLTFQVSTDGGFYHDVHDYKGDEIAINVTPNATVILDTKWGEAIAHLKVRSGTAESPVVQEADREFSVVVRTPFPLEAPVAVNAQLMDTRTVNVEFSMPLDQSVMPATTSFVINYSNSTRDTSEIIFFSSTTVRLTVSQSMSGGSGVCMVSYLTPTSSWLRSVGGVAVESFSNFPVTVTAVVEEDGDAGA